MKNLLLFTAIAFNSTFLIACDEKPVNVQSSSTESVELQPAMRPEEGNQSVINTSQEDPGDVLVTDPNENAFTIRMPKGWKNEAYLNRVYEMYRAISTSISPDKRTVIYIGDPRVPSYMIPNDIINENTQLVSPNPLMKVSHFVPAQQYITSYVKSKFGKLPGFRILESGENPDYLQVLRNSMERAGASGFNITAVRVLFNYQLDGKQMHALINGATLTNGTVWVVDINGISTEDNPMAFQKRLLKMADSHRTNKEWLAQQQQHHEQRMASLRRDYQNNQIAFNASNERHRIRMNGIQEASRIHNENWKSQQASIDKNHERFLNLIRNEHTVTDNTGNTFQVDNSHQKYFVNKNDKTYIGTHGTTSLDDLRKIRGVNPDDYEEVKIIR